MSLRRGRRRTVAALTWLIASLAWAQPLPVPGVAADPALAHAAWTVQVRQGGQVVTAAPAGQPLRLQRAAFEFIFEGPWNLAYGVLASARCADLPSPTAGAGRISAAIRPDNLAAESDDPKDNRFLVVNMAGAVPSGDNAAHLWGESAEDPLMSFQRREVTRALHTRSVREVAQLQLRHDFRRSRSVAVEDTTVDEVCVLLTGLPPGEDMLHTHPKLLRLHFGR